MGLTFKYQLFFFFFCLLSLLFPSSFSSSFSSNSPCSALLHFNNSLSLDGSASPPLDTPVFSYDPYYRSNTQMCENSYPKTASWKEDKDCCSWDGVECDNATRHVIGLDLSCSWLSGSIHSNSSLFLLRHLRSLNLAVSTSTHTGTRWIVRQKNAELPLQQTLLMSKSSRCYFTTANRNWDEASYSTRYLHHPYSLSSSSFFKQWKQHIMVIRRISPFFHGPQSHRTPFFAKFLLFSASNAQ